MKTIEQSAKALRTIIDRLHAQLASRYSDNDDAPELREAEVMELKQLMESAYHLGELIASDVLPAVRNN